MTGGRLDVASLAAIDVHVHVHADTHGHLALDDELGAAAARYFKGDPYDPAVPDIAEDYRRLNMAAVIFTVDAEAATGQPALSNSEIADLAAQHPDVLIPFGSIDPARGTAGLKLARRLVEEHGVRGFKFHPSFQNFVPNDPAVYPLYAEIEALGVPALFHTGQTGIGAGLPGGRGIKLRYSDPMLLDDVAADFPGLTIIMAHPSVPWQDAAISVATHKANVYIDLSGWSPKYFPPQLVHAANRQLKHKVLFGSDYPLIRPERWLADFEKLEIRDEVRPLVLKDNAIKALGLA
ncbi:amidohydrolase family protein [Cryptosporangium phraense]|uniref:Amidohydrolase n=1 Tax=Cryptosporangium phraense TaxID=2593070 RepID=A0A545ALA3_9ACTN|nr:amidohydrolase family protein [Cryptosporangium phraense]TQS42099.1 amidohydrolase [Cryptosporangium phraense]